MHLPPAITAFWHAYKVSAVNGVDETRCLSKRSLHIPKCCQLERCRNSRLEVLRRVFVTAGRTLTTRAG